VDPAWNPAPWSSDEKLTFAVYIARRMMCRIMTDVCFWVPGKYDVTRSKAIPHPVKRLPSDAIALFRRHPPNNYN